MGLLDTIDSLYTRYNTLLKENEYGHKYHLGDARMFIIEGTDKVRDVIEKNRKRKLTKHKKLSNNTVIEIDNCSPLELLKLQMNLVKIAEGEEISFVYGKRHTKTESKRQINAYLISIWYGFSFKLYKYFTISLIPLAIFLHSHPFIVPLIIVKPFSV